MNRLFLLISFLLMGGGVSSLLGQINITSAPGGSGLGFQFEVVESELSPPLAPVDGLPEPEFRPFIEFGDGYYGYGSPVHTYTDYMSLDEYRVKSVVNPLYSNSEQPPDLERDFDARALSQSMADAETVIVDLCVGPGQGSARFWTSDLTVDYVRFNSEYHT